MIEPPRRTRLAVLVSCASLTLLAPAYAQDDKDRARDAFVTGERAFDRDDYPTALAEFRRAQALAPRDAVRFNIAVCLERMGRFREAVAEYDAAAASGELGADERARAKRDSDKAARRLGTLAVEGSPRGAQVFVDGKAECAIPCEIRLDPRGYAIVVRQGAAESSQRVTLTEGARTQLRIELSTPGRQPRRTTPPTRPPPPEADTGPSPGALTWIGGGLVVAGGAGAVGFGLNAARLSRDYDASPTVEERDDGRTMVTLTNISIGVAVVGGVLIALDLFVLPSGSKQAGGVPAIRF